MFAAIQYRGGGVPHFMATLRQILPLAIACLLSLSPLLGVAGQGDEPPDYFDSTAAQMQKPDVPMPDPTYVAAWLDPASILADALDGELTFAIGSNSFTFSATEVELFAPGWRAIRTDDEGTIVEETDEADIHPFRLTTSDFPDLISSLTVGPGFIGANLSPNPCTTLSLETVESAEELVKVNVAIWGPPVETPCVDALPARPGQSGGAAGQGAADPPDGPSAASHTISYIEILIDGDHNFYEAHPSTWASYQVNLINTAQNQIYSPDLNVQFLITYQFVGRAIGTDTACGAREQTADFWRQYPGYHRDVVLLLADQPFTTGSVGCAWFRGVADPIQDAYAVMQTWNVDATREYKLAAHEVGHVFGGHHDAAISVGAGWCYLGYWTHYTIMKDSATCRVNSFSGWTYSYNDYHNSHRIRWCVDFNYLCDEFHVPDL